MVGIWFCCIYLKTIWWYLCDLIYSHYLQVLRLCFCTCFSFSLSIERFKNISFNNSQTSDEFTITQQLCEYRKMGRGTCPGIVQPCKLVFGVFVFHLRMEQSLGDRLFGTCPVLEGLRCNCVFVFDLWVACRLAKYQLVLAHWCIGVGARVHIWGVTRPRK